MRILDDSVTHDLETPEVIESIRSVVREVPETRQPGTRYIF